MHSTSSMPERSAPPRRRLRAGSLSNRRFPTSDRRESPVTVPSDRLASPVTVPDRPSSYRLRPVTPTMEAQSYSSWDPKVPPAHPQAVPPHPHAVPPEVVVGSNRNVRSHDNRSVVSHLGRSSPVIMDPPNPAVVDDEMPMDEAQDTIGRPSSSFRTSAVPMDEPHDSHSLGRYPPSSPTKRRNNHRRVMRSVDAADRGGGHAADEVSSLGGIEDQSHSLHKLTVALITQTTTKTPSVPANLSLDEKALWDAIQKQMTSVKSEATQAAKSEVERQRQTEQEEAQLIEHELEIQLQESNERLVAFQGASMRTHDQLRRRERELEGQLKESHEKLQAALVHNKENAPDGDTARVQELQAQLEQATARVAQLETKTKSEEKTPPASPSYRNRHTQTIKIRRLEEKLSKAEASLTESQALQQEAQQALEAQQEQHAEAIRAMQRVMADVTKEKDDAVEQAQGRLEEIKEEMEQVKRDAEEAKQNQARASPTAEASSSGEMASLRARAQRAFQLEREMEELKTCVQKTEEERDALQRSLEQKISKVTLLERELMVSKSSLTQAKQQMTEEDHSKERFEELENELVATQVELDSFIEREQKLSAMLDSKDKQIRKLKKHLSGQSGREGPSEDAAGIPGIRSVPSNLSAASGFSVASGDVGALTEENAALAEEVVTLEELLKERDQSLENAKKIITSLESASGNLAADSRGKLKEKEEKIISLETEAADRQHTLDSLATELRDLQRQQDELDHVKRSSAFNGVKQTVLAEQLETALTEIQNASVVHEAMTENGSMDAYTLEKVANVLNTTIVAIRVASSEMAMSDTGMDDSGTDIGTDIGSVSSEVNRQLDAIIKNDREAAAADLREKLEENTKTIKTLEESLKKQVSEVEMLRRDNLRSKTVHDEVETNLKAEIMDLQRKCQTNMEVLAKKEQELEVLRDSLEVNDGVGYISGDDSEGEEEEGAPTRAPTEYGHSQAEALATLIVQSGSGIETTNRAALEEVDSLRKELTEAQRAKDENAKALQSEKESLANAKLIISSLEKANKNMMEDLRHRLQDSNTAISSLLDKSTEHEKTTAALQEELDALKAEKQKESKEHREVVQKMKDDILVKNLRIQAKDRDLKELRELAEKNMNMEAIVEGDEGEEAE